MDTENGAAQEFTLNSGTDYFTSRKKDVFAGLDAVEQKHSAFLKASNSAEAQSILKDDPDDETHALDERRRDHHARSRRQGGLSDTRDSDFDRRRSHSRDKQSRDQHCERRSPAKGNDSEFKRPVRPNAHFRNGRGRPRPVPDFKKNPDKWTEYSLRDVSEKDMSDKSNTRAALAFLEERKAQRLREERQRAGLDEEEEKFNTEEAACSQGVIAFSRRSHHTDGAGENSKSSTNKNNAPGILKGLPTQPDHVDNVGTEEDLSGHDEGNQMDDEDGALESRPQELCADGFSVSSTFKSRKNVRRVIRRKGSDSGDDDST